MCVDRVIFSGYYVHVEATCFSSIPLDVLSHPDKKKRDGWPSRPSGSLFLHIVCISSPYIVNLNNMYTYVYILLLFAGIRQRGWGLCKTCVREEGVADPLDGKRNWLTIQIFFVAVPLVVDAECIRRPCVMFSFAISLALFRFPYNTVHPLLGSSLSLGLLFIYFYYYPFRSADDSTPPPSMVWTGFDFL